MDCSVDSLLQGRPQAGSVHTSGSDPGLKLPPAESTEHSSCPAPDSLVLEAPLQALPTSRARKSFLRDGDLGGKHLGLL